MNSLNEKNRTPYIKVDESPLHPNLEILTLIDSYWKFDNNQQPQSSWHEKQALLEAVKKILQRSVLKNRTLKLTDSEQKLFNVSGTKEIKFVLGGGIGYSVKIKTDKGKWKDITDYSSW